MTRQAWLAFPVVYGVMVALDTVMKVLMWNFYPGLPLNVLRPRAEMMLWLCPVGFLFAAFFLTFFFSKLYRGTGIREGVLYGLYMNLMVNPLIGLGFYAFLPIRFDVAIGWFLSRTVILLVTGAVLAGVFGRRAQEAPVSLAA